MIVIKVTDGRLTVEGHASVPGDPVAQGAICGVVSALSQGIGAVCGDLTARDGYTSAALPPPGDRVREFVLGLLESLAMTWPNQVMFTEVASARAL